MKKAQHNKLGFLRTLLEESVSRQCFQQSGRRMVHRHLRWRSTCTNKRLDTRIANNLDGDRIGVGSSPSNHGGSTSYGSFGHGKSAHNDAKCYGCGCGVDCADDCVHRRCVEGYGAVDCDVVDYDAAGDCHPYVAEALVAPKE